MKISYTFRANQRIKRKKEFKQLYEKSFRIYGSSFVYRFTFSCLNNSKLGVSISKRFGNAVYRNRIKRYIREAFRYQEFPYPVDLLISQSKPLKKNYRSEFNTVFNIFSDYYLLQQCSVSTMALSTIHFSKSLSIGAKILFHIILFYKRYVSKNLTPSCRFTPSCSVYALDVLRIHTFWYALWLIIKRILSCHPFGRSGYDPTPPSKHQSKEKKARS